MELRQLEHFLAVAGAMNFSRAAEQAHVVQSALSMSIGKLEKELGVELFDRTKQQIKITPAGELFREHARRVIQTARLAKDSLSDFRGELSGTVDLGSLISFGTLDVPKVLGSSTAPTRLSRSGYGRVKQVRLLTFPRSRKGHWTSRWCPRPIGFRRGFRCS